MRILGVDPGFARLGFGSVEISGEDVLLLSYGVIAHERDPQVSFNAHLSDGVHQLANDFPRLLDLVKPDQIVGEMVPVGHLGSNDALVITALACVQLIAWQFGVPYMHVAASTVKKELTGNGRATKAQVRDAVFALYPRLEVKHKAIKAEEKQAGEKPQGLPQDVFDGVGIAYVGARRLIGEHGKTLQAV